MRRQTNSPAGPLSPCQISCAREYLKPLIAAIMMSGTSALVSSARSHQVLAAILGTTAVLLSLLVVAASLNERKKRRQGTVASDNSETAATVPHDEIRFDYL